MNNAFQILGITPSTPLKEAKKKYHQLLKKYHPDKGGDKEATQNIIEAWKIVQEFLSEEGIENQKQTFVNQEQFDFQSLIKRNIPKSNWNLQTFYFDYAPKVEIMRYPDNFFEFIFSHEFFLKLWAFQVKKSDTAQGQGNWFYFGTDYNLSQIQGLTQETKNLFGQIYPGRNFNIKINFDKNSEVISHYLIQQPNGKYKLSMYPKNNPEYNEEGEVINKRKETIFTCSNCKSEKWENSIFEDTTVSHCYICNKYTNFTRKKY